MGRILHEGQLQLILLRISLMRERRTQHTTHYITTLANVSYPVSH